jgi:hypothetical protein
MKKLLLISYVLSVILLFSCGQTKAPEKQNQITTALTDSHYKIISEKDHVDSKFGINKCNIEIEIKSKITIDELKSIANKLRETRKSYDKLWIAYFLPDMKDGSGAWAITNFTPNLEAEIIGTTNIEEKKMNDVIVDGNVIGKWQDVRLMAECGLILFEKNKKIYMKRSFGDGSSVDDEFIKKNYNGKIRYELKQNIHKEFYLIEDNGNLGMYGKDGKFGEAIKKPENVDLQKKADRINDKPLDEKKEIKEYHEEPKNDLPKATAISEKDFANRAYVISQSFVKQRLKSPKSADFSLMDFSYSKVNDNTITVKSYVDSQNDYGTEIRNNYVIVLKLIGNEWADATNWQMLNLTFE